MTRRTGYLLLTMLSLQVTGCGPKCLEYGPVYKKWRPPWIQMVPVGKVIVPILHQGYWYDHRDCSKWEGEEDDE